MFTSNLLLYRFYIFRFEFVSLEGTNYDKIDIYDGHSTSDFNLLNLGERESYVPTNNIYSSGNKMLIHFSSDTSMVAYGFSFKFTDMHFSGPVPSSG